ncbi:MAG: SpoIID/LytB domain-containing protein, partial [Nocardioidaceae bacterium]
MRRRSLGMVMATVSAMATAAVAVGLGVSPAGAVSTNQSYWVPVDKQVVVRGHGYGHGHGMSQYGARGAAQEGKSYKEIVDFYYPGTSWAKMRGRVRVLITADSTTDVIVSPTTGLSVRDLGSGETYELPTGDSIRRWRLVVRDGSKAVLQKLTDRWRPQSLGGKRLLDGDGEFFASGPITLWTPSGQREYRGILRAASPTPGSSERDTVNVVSMDEYVMGVVPYEMPASWHPEAVKAQAVAARTYATWSRAQYLRRYYQICDTTSCQVYGGKSAEDYRGNRAVAATSRQILTYDGKPAFTQFSSSSGGWTSKGSVPYLPAQEDPYDGLADNPVHNWSATIDAGRFERTYPQLGDLRRIVVVNREGGGEWQGRVQSVLLEGTDGKVTITGDTFRWAYGLRSNWFSIDPTPIINRWASIGGSKSPLGDARTGEYAVERGSAQRFDNGKIFYSPRTGARELYGPILRSYQRYGGPSSALGLPTTPVRGRKAGFLAHFEGGSIFSHSEIGPVPVVGRIAERYAKERAARSGLGWPTRSNYAVTGGERVDFENGSIRW